MKTSTTISYTMQQGWCATVDGGVRIPPEDTIGILGEQDCMKACSAEPTCNAFMLWNDMAEPGMDGQCAITLDGGQYKGDLGPDGADIFVGCYVKSGQSSTTTGGGTGLTECEKSRDMRMTFTSVCTIDQEDDMTNAEAMAQCSARTPCNANSDCPLDHHCGRYEKEAGTATNECVLTKACDQDLSWDAMTLNVSCPVPRDEDPPMLPAGYIAPADRTDCPDDPTAAAGAASGGADIGGDPGF